MTGEWGNYHYNGWKAFLTENNSSGVIVAIFGPTASGKSVARDIFVDNGWSKIVSYTTRAPRPGSDEIKKQEYEFISPEEFTEFYDNDQLINVNLAYAGSSYGNDKETLQATQRGVLITDKSSILRLKKELRDLGKKVIVVYVTADPSELANRQTRRKVSGEYESDEQLGARMAELEKELAKDNKVQSLADYVIDEDDIEATMAAATQLSREL
tara:strand:- start:1665 stop:2303 length:639 start_codon:yes stop_codon:yes gene_type:complete